MSIFHNTALAGASGAAGGGAGGYQIQRSLRFNSSDSAYLSRTPSSAGNRKTWTLSLWLKRSKLGDFEVLFGAGDASSEPNFDIDFGAGGGDSLRIRMTTGGGTQEFQLKTTQVFRDLSSWYHILVAFDTTQSTASNRIKLYVNGSQVTAFSTEIYPSQNLDTWINATTYQHVFGRLGAYNSYYLNGYLADCYLIDGQALTPSSFTEVSATTGQLIPKAYTGTFTGNSFWLKFEDNSAATATTLGKDSSGLGNNWTPNNLYVSNTVYSSGVSITGSYANNTNARMAFDGSTSTKLEMSGSNNQITFTPPAAISFSSTVEVFLTPTGNVTYTRYSFNGGADTSFAAGDGWKTVASGGGTFTSLVLKQGAQTNNIGFAAIRINGSTILVDASSADNDSLTDTPTSYGTDTGAGGDVRGNYATLNPLANGASTLSNGNLDAATSTTINHVRGTIGVTSGKWYWECTVTLGQDLLIGYVNSAALLSEYPGNNVNGWSYYANNGSKYNNGGTSYGASYTTGDIIGIAFDADAGSLTFYKNGTSQGVAFTGLTSGPYFPAVGNGGNFNRTYSCNFGQRPFAYTAPSGFKALCDTNLPAPVVAKPSTVMDVKLYTGTGSTQTISGLGFSPDFVWLKARSAPTAHLLFDQIRGATYYLSSNATDAESNSPSNTLTAFTSDGFTLGSNSSANGSSVTLAAWTWDAGSSTVTNTQGSITSQVRANASAGFSICSWTAPASGNFTWGHGLGVEPHMVIVKTRASAGYNWRVYHKSIITTVFENIDLNSTGAKFTSGTNMWGAALPTSTVVGSTANNTVGANEASIAYCFAPVAGYSSFGSYTGNGSADGPFVYTGFRPRWVMVKNTNDGLTSWWIQDSTRSTFNVGQAKLAANLSDAENTAFPDFDFTSNGFKVRNSGTALNASSQTIIYAAFAESPFQFSRAR